MKLQILLSLDYRSVVRLGSVDRYFRGLQFALGNTEKRDSLLRLELSHSKDHLRRHDLFPCYGCLEFCPRSAFLDFSDLPGFEIGGPRAVQRLCGTHTIDNNISIPMAFEHLDVWLEKRFTLSPEDRRIRPALRDRFGTCGKFLISGEIGDPPQSGTTQDQGDVTQDRGCEDSEQLATSHNTL